QPFLRAVFPLVHHVAACGHARRTPNRRLRGKPLPPRGLSRIRPYTTFPRFQPPFVRETGQDRGTINHHSQNLEPAQPRKMPPARRIAPLVSGTVLLGPCSFLQTSWCRRMPCRILRCSCSGSTSTSL